MRALVFLAFVLNGCGGYVSIPDAQAGDAGTDAPLVTDASRDSADAQDGRVDAVSVTADASAVETGCPRPSAVPDACVY